MLTNVGNMTVIEGSTFGLKYFKDDPSLGHCGAEIKLRASLLLFIVLISSWAHPSCCTGSVLKTLAESEAAESEERRQRRVMTPEGFINRTPGWSQ